MFNSIKVFEELDRLHDQAKSNGLPAATCRAFASGELHSRLAAIISRWQDGKLDQEERENSAGSDNLP